MPLTDTAIRAVKPAENPQKPFDGNGLFLFISPSGIKSRRLTYRFQGTQAAREPVWAAARIANLSPELWAGGVANAL